jgi:ATP/maltotriose-dependent transcriptional regulator MalT
MTPLQAATLLRLAALELEFESVQSLWRQTEGWPVGLYLAALSLRGQDDVGDGLEQFSGGDHLIAEYFRDEYLAQLPDRSGALPDPQLRARRPLGAAVRRGAAAERHRSRSQ